MIGCRYVLAMAAYNEWMNAKLYEAAGRLPAQALAADRGAFFRSIIGTLNHIAVADTIWLQRFAKHPSHHEALEPVRHLPAPGSLDEILFSDLGALYDYRKRLDEAIDAWAAALTEADLLQVLHYRSMKGVAAQKRFAGIVVHFFNHQTHHRGQATTLLSQAGQDVGVTDLLAMFPDE